jgi:hypothetical protein
VDILLKWQSEKRYLIFAGRKGLNVRVKNPGKENICSEYTLGMGRCAKAA